MPKQQDRIILQDANASNALPIAYETFTQLGWQINFAGSHKLLASTTSSWKTKGQQIVVGIENESLTIESEMVHGETVDLTGRNKKNLATFIQKYNEVKQQITADTIANNNNAIAALITKTNAVTQQQEKDAEEINTAMNLAGSNLYATYIIMGINVLVFILMVLDGAGIMATNQLVHIKWGSNYTVLTLSGDWWRLLTSTFIHFGIIHIALNMYCLYTVGVYLEPMLGKAKYITAYLCTGVLASVASLWWHSEGTNSAGASGAIFGMYGLFFALLTTNLIPKTLRGPLLSSIGIFIVYNLISGGAKSGIDNAAHIGGLVSGFAIGYLFVLAIKKERQGLKATWILPLVILLTIATTATYLQKNKITDLNTRNEILTEVKADNFKDNDKYNEALDKVSKYESIAVNIMNDTAINAEVKKQKLQTTCVEQWAHAEKELTAMQAMNVSEEKKTKTNMLIEYVNLKKEDNATAIKVLDNEAGASEKLDSIRTKINVLIEKIK